MTQLALIDAPVSCPVIRCPWPGCALALDMAEEGVSDGATDWIAGWAGQCKTHPWVSVYVDADEARQ